MKPFLINRFAFLMSADPLETEVWKTLEIRSKIVGFSSFGKFQDSNGIKKTVTPSKGGIVVYELLLNFSSFII